MERQDELPGDASQNSGEEQNVTFRTDRRASPALSPRERHSEVRNPERRTTFNLSNDQLQDIVAAATRESVGQAMRDFSRLSTSFSEEQGIRTTKAKLKTPETFNGDYHWSKNAITWLQTLRRYLRGTKTDRELWTDYAASYLSESVLQWYEQATVPVRDERGRVHEISVSDSTNFSHFQEALLARYMPVDHENELRNRYQSISQGAKPLKAFLAEWEELLVAMKLGEICPPEPELVFRFINCLRNADDRRQLLIMRLTSLRDAQNMALLICDATTAAHRRTTYNQNGTNRRLLF